MSTTNTDRLAQVTNGEIQPAEKPAEAAIRDEAQRILDRAQKLIRITLQPRVKIWFWDKEQAQMKLY